ncbi:PTS sugar transporter subunit IIA, partial [Mycoplasmopsis pullorum]
VMILDDFVRFNNQEDKEARIIVTLSAVDSSSHLNILQEFSHYFMNDEFKKEILQVKNIEEFWNLIDKYKA